MTSHVNDIITSWYRYKDYDMLFYMDSDAGVTPQLQERSMSDFMSYWRTKDARVVLSLYSHLNNSNTFVFFPYLNIYYLPYFRYELSTILLWCTVVMYYVDRIIDKRGHIPALNILSSYHPSYYSSYYFPSFPRGEGCISINPRSCSWATLLRRKLPALEVSTSVILL